MVIFTKRELKRNAGKLTLANDSLLHAFHTYADKDDLINHTPPILPLPSFGYNLTGGDATRKAIITSGNVQYVTEQVANGFGFLSVSTYTVKGKIKLDLKTVIKSKVSALTNMSLTKNNSKLKTHPWNYSSKLNRFVFNGSVV